MEKIDLQQIWSELEKHTVDGKNSGIIKRLISPDLGYKSFLGIEIGSKSRLFILEAPYKFLRNQTPLPQSNGFEALIRHLGDEEEHFLSIVLNVKHAQYNDLFASLALDLFDILNTSNPNEVVEIFINRLARWQKFLNTSNIQVLSENAQRGLYGELYFFNRLIENLINGYDVTSSWGGPEKTVQDFRFKNCAVEIKTSISKKHQKITISNERQLDDSNLKHLLLCHLSLDNESLTGQSLNQIVAIIREKLKYLPNSLRIFEDKLFDYGYIDLHIEHYEKPTYSIREYRLFKIEDGFPRITEKNLPEGVGDVKYSIVVSGLDNFLIKEMEMVRILKESINE